MSRSYAGGVFPIQGDPQAHRDHQQMLQVRQMNDPGLRDDAQMQLVAISRHQTHIERPGEAGIFSALGSLNEE